MGKEIYVRGAAKVLSQSVCRILLIAVIYLQHMATSFGAVSAGDGSSTELVFFNIYMKLANKSFFKRR